MHKVFSVSARLTRAVSICVLSAIANASIFAADSATPARDPLDGLRFEGLTGEKGKGDHHEDTITFKEGLFRSLDCENWGFGAAPYTVAKEGDSYRFSATLLSEDRGRLEWAGTVSGDTAEGDFRWIHERWYWDIDRQYWFKGKRTSDN